MQINSNNKFQIQIVARGLSDITKKIIIPIHISKEEAAKIIFRYYTELFTIGQGVNQFICAFKEPEGEHGKFTFLLIDATTQEEYIVQNVKEVFSQATQGYVNLRIMEKITNMVLHDDMELEEGIDDINITEEDPSE